MTAADEQCWHIGGNHCPSHTHTHHKWTGQVIIEKTDLLHTILLLCTEWFKCIWWWHQVCTLPQRITRCNLNQSNLQWCNPDLFNGGAGGTRIFQGHFGCIKIQSLNAFHIKCRVRVRGETAYPWRACAAPKHQLSNPASLKTSYNISIYSGQNQAWQCLTYKCSRYTLASISNILTDFWPLQSQKGLNP